MHNIGIIGLFLGLYQVLNRTKEKNERGENKRVSTKVINPLMAKFPWGLITGLTNNAVCSKSLAIIALSQISNF